MSHTLIFDIETVGEAWETLDETTKTVLSRWIDRTARDESEHDAEMKDLREGLGFSPLTGMVVAIGLYDLERKQGVVYYQSDTSTPEVTHGEFVLKSRSEKEMLKDFLGWRAGVQYLRYV